MAGQPVAGQPAAEPPPTDQPPAEQLTADQPVTEHRGPVAGQPVWAAPDEIWIEDTTTDATTDATTEGGETARRGGPGAAAGRGGGRRPEAPGTTAGAGGAGGVDPVAADLVAAFSARVEPRRAQRLAARVQEAADALSEDRYRDAEALLRDAVREVGDVPAVRELHGLVLYRLGRWRPALRELEARRAVAGSDGAVADLLPVIADCYRALQRWSEVDAVVDALEALPVSKEVLTEARLVAVGALADQGRLGDAVARAEEGFARPKRAKPHHLRHGYVLADLCERAGDLPRARELFEWVARADDGATDAAERRDALG